VVFLTGNPGDGKTAFLERFRQSLVEDEQARDLQLDSSGWEVETPDGHVYRACFDASEAFQGKTADEQLSYRLRNLEDASISEGEHNLTVLVAINDGRLGEILERFGPLGFGKVVDLTAKSQLAGSLSLESSVWVVDLKQRSYVDLAPNPEQPSVMRQMLASLTAEQHWSICKLCSASPVCPIYSNAVALGSKLPDSAPDQLEQLLLLAHLRGERHITVRDLSSGLALLITGDLGCADIHDRMNDTAGLNDGRLTPWESAYWHTAFTTPRGRDIVLGELEPLDPARFSAPALERFLYFRQRPADAAQRARLFVHGRDMAPGAHSISWLEAMKRSLVFEGGYKHHRSPDATVLPTAGPEDLLPYQSAREFIPVLAGTADPITLLPNILQGISRSDGLAAAGSGDDLLLSITRSTEQRLEIVKRFPAAEFQLEVTGSSQATDNLIETVSRSLILEHSRSQARVRITLDLYETLVRLAGGLDPGSPELQPLLEELGPFKSQVQLSTSDELILIDSDWRYHRISRRGALIVREELTTSQERVS
jgi:hypothetical protein